MFGGFLVDFGWIFHGFLWILPVKIVIFHYFVYVYQRVCFISFVKITPIVLHGAMVLVFVYIQNLVILFGQNVGL